MEMKIPKFFVGKLETIVCVRNICVYPTAHKYFGSYNLFSIYKSKDTLRHTRVKIGIP